jgi:hypothetical protein
MLGETNHGKKDYKNIVHARDYYPPHIGPGAKDAQSREKELNFLDKQIVVIILKKEEFMRQIDGCKLPEVFDQDLLDNASEMFSKWGMTTHMDEKEHLFKSFGLVPKPGDNDAIRKEKEALLCVCKKMMDTKLNRKDAAVIIKNFNKIKEPEFEWVEG